MLLPLQGMVVFPCTLKNSVLPPPHTAQELSWAEVFAGAQAHASHIILLSDKTEMNSNTPVMALSGVSTNT